MNNKHLVDKRLTKIKERNSYVLNISELCLSFVDELGLEPRTSRL